MAKQSQIKKCPYCGEEILAVAKKCKHCGEWIKEEDVVVEVKKRTCPICGEEIDATATVCPVCHETIRQSKNTFHEKMITEKKDSSESKIYHNGCFWILIIIAIVIIAICISGFVLKDSATSNDSSANASDSIMPVEEVFYQESEEENYTPGVDYSEGVIGGSTNNGEGNTSGDAGIDYSEYSGDNNGNYEYNRSDYYGN